MSGAYSLAAAGRWLLHSGIQNPDGGVARFYRADVQKNMPVSTEITGYVASALMFLYRTTGSEAYLERARLTANFLCDRAWNVPLQTFPFEHPSPSDVSQHRAYFFDCGIIVRGLLSVWRETGEDRLLDVALLASRGMIADFHSGSDYHPILDLPGKQPVGRADQWSRLPGCYQLKPALAWWEVAEATGDEALRAAWFRMLDASLASYGDFLPGASDRQRVMDRLHAFGYFLEGLSPALDRADCVEAYRVGIETMSRTLRDIAPEFVRSDVYAQLLRARIRGAGSVPLDAASAREEAEALSGFQIHDDDPRLDGAFLFGRRDGQMVPHANPVSTAFALQALEMWRLFEAGDDLAQTIPI